MPRRLPLHVERNHVKGHTYLYFRRAKGPRVRLPDDPTSAQFMTAYRAMLTGEYKPAVAVPLRSAPGTIAWLIGSYFKSSAFAGLRETTKSGYRSRLEKLRRDHGHRELSGLTRPRVVKILEAYAEFAGAGHDTLKKIRILVRHAINIGVMTTDPTIGIRRPKLQRIRAWTENEIDTYRNKWSLDTKERLAFELFLGTGQRRSDVVKMVWSHITNDNKIHIQQQKTGRRLVVPLHADTLNVLARRKRDHVAILTTVYGKPFTVDGFSQWFRSAITEAGLPLECQPHGLRKAAGRRLAEAGASASEVMAILGHTTLSEAQRYIEDADQIALAERAVVKLERSTTPQTTFQRLGKQSKREGKSTWNNQGWRSLGESNPCFSLERAAS